MERVPWLPSKLPEGANPESCPRCKERALIRWTLRRDLKRQVWRTWVCTYCQTAEERLEPE